MPTDFKQMITAMDENPNTVYAIPLIFVLLNLKEEAGYLKILTEIRDMLKI